MPVVGLPNEPVPHTRIPRSAAAVMSIEALRAPVVMMSLRSGSTSMVLRRKGVRSRIMQTMWKSLRAR